MTTSSSRLAFIAVALLTAVPAPTRAQDWSFIAGGGIMRTLGENVPEWDSGPTALLGFELSNGAWFFRVAGEWSRLSRGPGLNESGRIDLRTYGGSFNVLRKITDESIQPYLLIGVGRYRLDEDDHHNPYGATWAAQIGAGINGPIRFRVHPFLEARAMVHFTNYGTGRDFTTLKMVTPIMVGIRIR